ncbi:MAG: acetyl-CoA C-acetyltransferase [Euryarchaeota archaeon]|nr:acetyl-CoA C-acetyltransferase [Euryarchaeota archaeon]
MTGVVITAACRTAIGKFQGTLRPFSAPQLGAKIVEETVRRSGLSTDQVEEVIMGNVLQAGLGQNPARQAALYGGLPDTVNAFTVNKVCGSSLKAVMLAAQAIKCGDATRILAGGMESMTNAPYLLPDARDGFRMFDKKAVDSMIHDGLWDVYSDQHMGVTGEIVAKRHDVSRGDADRFAMLSHQKAERATKEGLFQDEILPIEIEDKRSGETTFFAEDEGIRHMVHMQKLSRLKPVFDPTGMVTAGNASQISDGASAVMVESEASAKERGAEVLGRIIAYGSGGVRPEHVMEAPITTTKRVMKEAGFTSDDFDLFEHNEAFATASCAVMKGLDIPEEKFNIHGGAVALGHPIGASGARVLTTLLYSLKQTGGHRGLATLCLGGGNAVTMVVERPEA